MLKTIVLPLCTAFALSIAGCDAPPQSAFTATPAERYQTPQPGARLREQLLPVYCQAEGSKPGQAGTYRIRSVGPQSLEVMAEHPDRPSAATRFEVSAVNEDLIAAATRTVRKNDVRVVQALMISSRDRAGKRKATLSSAIRARGDTGPTLIIVPLDCIDGA